MQTSEEVAACRVLTNSGVSNIMAKAKKIKKDVGLSHYQTKYCMR